MLITGQDRVHRLPSREAKEPSQGLGEGDRVPRGHGEYHCHRGHPPLALGGRAGAYSPATHLNKSSTVV